VYKKFVTDPTAIQLDPVQLRAAMTRRLHRRAVVKGKFELPAVPGLTNEYAKICETVFAAVGRSFTPEQITRLKEILRDQLTQAYEASHRSKIVISYEAPVGTVLNYFISWHALTIEGTYENWIATRQPPLFGTEPDARVWALAGEATNPAVFPILDIGAGTGRNALPLARRGHPIDVVEVTAKFADMIRAEADRDGLDLRVIQRDIFTTSADLRRDYMLILLSEVVPEFRTSEELRKMFEVAAQCLAPGGRLVFNAFLARRDFHLDDTVRQFAEQAYSNLFTWEEMSSAAVGLPLELVADDSVYEYERTHLPDGAWPPTGWYARWAAGQDVFDLERTQCPNELRWLVYQKVGP
jgi:SAM-dependent methyltransferase